MSWVLISIIFYALILRFWSIGQIPPLLHQTYLSGRLVSASLNLLSILLLYWFVKKNYHNIRLALLSSFMFALSPWVIEQSRIVSPVNNALFVLLLISLIFQLHRRSIIKLLVMIFALPVIYLIYPQLWIFGTKQLMPHLTDMVNNIFILTSPDFLFFKNITFWWGGVREFGVMYLSLLPFFFVGLYKVIINKKLNIIIWLSIILLFSAASPFFPESREFFLATPFISILIASGILVFIQSKEISIRILLIIVLIIFLYDFGQYLHYYQIHYPQNILSNISKINEPF